MAKLTWDDVHEIRARAQAGIEQRDIAAAFNISRPLCSAIVRGHIWNPEVKLTTGDEMRDRIIGALDTGCRRGEMLKIQNKQVDWRHRWIRILKEHSKTEVARVIPFEAGSRLEKLLRRRAFLGPDAYVFGEATTGAYVASLRSAWETLLLLANGIKPTRAGSGKRVSNRKALAQIDLHWHDLRHEALSRLADDGVPVHELQLLAGHASITTTQRYMNARASSLAESMRQARERRVNRVEHADEATVSDWVKECRTEQGWHATDCQPIVSRRSIRVRQIHKRVKTLRILVGATGFEPATPCAQGRCATRLRYAPTASSLPHRRGAAGDGRQGQGRAWRGSLAPAPREVLVDPYPVTRRYRPPRPLPAPFATVDERPAAPAVGDANVHTGILIAGVAAGIG